ncbi:hypothetical protein AADZ91_17890 [Colwelliaceae bacterium 6441]
MTNPLNYQISLFTEENYFHVQVTGDATPEAIIKMYNDLTLFGKAHNIANILVNISSVLLTYSSSEILKSMQKLQPILFGFKIARVVCMSNFKNDLIEAISEDKLMNVKNFDNNEMALDWLIRNPSTDKTITSDKSGLTTCDI